MITVELLGTRIYITENVLDIFKKYRQRGKDTNEKGGILLGQIDQHAENVLICRASLPSSADQLGRLFFNRSKESAQLIIEYENHNSQGYNTYLGEWHTHPSKTAEPSAQDINTIKKQYSTNDIKSDYLFLFIVGLNQIYVGMYNGEEFASSIVNL
jgi:integrative and conjugative element protein (TIGR02256 family)